MKSVNRAKGVIKQLVVPKQLRPQIVHSMHDDNGRPGLTRFYTCP